MVNYIADKIVYAYENYDSLFLYVVGRVGAGKTSFALHILREIYGSWNILNYVFFDIRKFMEKAYKKISKSSRYKAIVLDDAGATLNALRFREQEMMNIIEIFNFMRTICSGIIFTTPDVYDVLKRIRVKAMFIAQIFPISREKSLARIYETRYSAGYDKYYRKFLKEIEFPRHYPIHREYIKKRNNFIKKRMKELLKKNNNTSRTLHLIRTICPLCERTGILIFRITNNTIYLYIEHGRNDICWIGKLRENKQLFLQATKNIAIPTKI